ncbi:TonB-dependent receptor [bacterium]|nr:MAG: TonB-dependent receptor [bacterium]
MKNAYKKFVALGLFILIFSGIVQAEDVDLEKIVVTPYRYAETLSKVISSVTVITQDEIQNSNAQRTVDLLRDVPGVTVRDWYGNGTKVAVDMGGFGEQAALNVLVLVDGRRVNDVDLSGVDWSQIPIDQVERIEVMRGGSGAVLYGDNASSGVINIITKKGAGKPKVNLKAEYGSYDMNKQKISLDGEINNKFSYFLSGGRESTHGYRNNTFNKANDFSSRLACDFTDALSVHFDSGFHASSYGLPGALYQINIDQYGRRYARYADDHVNNKDYYFVFGTKTDIGGLGGLDIDFSYRRKDTNSYFLTSLSPTQYNKIETFGVTPKYTLDNNIFDHDNKFITGLDYYRVFYNSHSKAINPSYPDENFTTVNKTSLAGYLQDELSVLKQLTLVGGYRYEVARYVFGYYDIQTYPNPAQDKKIRPKMEAFNTGLVYSFKEDSNLFIDVAKSFRFPEVDEFNYTDQNYQQQIDTSLEPQSSINYQAGLRHKFSDRVKGSLSIFRMNVKNEIYYNAKDMLVYGYWNGKNENYDKTVHEGLDASLDTKLSDRIMLFGNYTFTNAYFNGGEYDNNEIPLVPRHKGSVGLRFTLPKNITLNLTGTYTGERYFLNDQANAYSKLNGYMVADTNLSWRYKELTVTFGINNFLGKEYSEYAGVLVDSGTKFYYPSPGRNFNLKLEYQF